MPKPHDVMVSCLLVTLPVPERLPHLQRSIDCFARQTHGNKELIIVSDAGDASTKAATAAYVASLGRDDIRIIDVPGKLSLGALRNISVASARGEMLCHWDDDDLHHPRRLELQLAALLASGSVGVCIQEIMLLFTQTRALYCTNWRATPVGGLPPTLMCKKSAPIRYRETGHDSQFGEDTAVALQLRQAGGLHLMPSPSYLYVYIYHGGNTWAAEHHRMLADRLAISRGLLLRREAELREGLGAYDFGAGAVTVCGSNGPAFVLGAEPDELAGQRSHA
jgi:glycosyltransferase involved in cell wall biosynthesis